MAEPSGPSPEVRAKLMQLREEFAKRAEEHRRRQQGQQNMEESLKRNKLPIGQADTSVEPRLASVEDMRQELMSKGGLTKFLKSSKVKSRMYHGTNSDFNKFREGTTFVSPDPEFASGWSGYQEGQENPHVMPLHVQVKNPFDYEKPRHVNKLISYLKKHPDTEKFLEEHGFEDLNRFKEAIPFGSHYEIELPHIQEAIKALGHDAFHVNEGTDNMTKNLGIYDPRKIKSAIGNRGTYDITNPDITKKRGGITHAHHLDIEERPL